MIPQILSSPATATGQAPPPSDAPRDANTAAFTLAAEDHVRYGLEATDLQVLVSLDPGTARTPGATVRADALSALAELATGRGAGEALHEELPGQLPTGRSTALRGAAVTATVADAALPQIGPLAGETIVNGANSRAPRETPSGTVTANPDIERIDARNSAAAVPPPTAVVEPARAPDPDRRDRLASMRGALPPAVGDVPSNDGLQATSRAQNSALSDPAKAQGNAPAPLAAATGDGATDPADRVAAAADAAVPPPDVDTARVEPGRTDTARAEPPRPDLARAVGNQLVEAIRHGPGGSTDVALNPEELGRVRLSLMAQDGVLHVTVLAERPETQDLMRRNIGLLQSDFRALGYTDVAFDFGRGGDRPDRHAGPAPMAADTQSETLVAAPDAPPAHPRATTASARLDLRL